MELRYSTLGARTEIFKILGTRAGAEVMWRYVAWIVAWIALVEGQINKKWSSNWTQPVQGKLSHLHEFSEAERDQVVHQHNHWRNLAASGQLPDINNQSFYAKNMQKLTYDLELEHNAQEFAKFCYWGHSILHKFNTLDYYMGENLYITSAKSINATFHIEKVLEDWSREHQNYNYLTQTCKFGQMCGHFSQVIWAETTKVGCAISFCESMANMGEWWEQEGGIFMVCQYSKGGNVKGKRPFEFGTSPDKIGQACPVPFQMDSEYGSLCADSSTGEEQTNPMGRSFKPAIEPKPQYKIQYSLTNSIGQITLGLNQNLKCWSVLNKNRNKKLKTNLIKIVVDECDSSNQFQCWKYSENNGTLTNCHPDISHLKVTFKPSRSVSYLYFSEKNFDTWSMSFDYNRSGHVYSRTDPELEVVHKQGKNYLYMQHVKMENTFGSSFIQEL